ncbi:hypothetical protein SNE40_010276 [Patella caerulea]|uniref:KANL3/Tex30 alpha/beta hydrolase-like domain-containing protein n=1 Tax=Patella caerulea TaxID=87958 RepID=A0AAN8PZR2_PATCE
MDSKNEEVEIEINKRSYPAIVTVCNTVKTNCGFILTHGAGGDMNTKQLILFSDHLAKHGFLVLRFTCKGLNLTYRNKIYLGVLKYLHESDYGLQHCILGGRSMGSRSAVDVANQIIDTELHTFVKGVVCISYPLYQPKQKDKLRDVPLKELKLPVLFISGSEDEMCEQNLLIKTVSNLEKTDFLWIKGALHSLEGKDIVLEDTVQKSTDTIQSWYHDIVMEDKTKTDIVGKRKNERDMATTCTKKKK